MNKILVLGAGRSSSCLISYLLKQAEIHQWQIVVGDMSVQAAMDRVGGSRHGMAIQFDISDNVSSKIAIASADVIVSLIPAHLHPLVAKICLSEGKHLLTASYVSDEMKSFHHEAQSKGLLFMNESGLDPGIDHMSAMQVIDKIKSRGGRLTSFESFTGGLIAPETEPENPWRYKFTWNPRNVVMAGQGTAKFLQDGTYKFIPYQQLFKRITPVTVPGMGEYEGYANRDSLKYLETYGLQGIKTMVRGTLRNKGFCSAWNVLVQLGCCDDTFQLDGLDKMSHCDYMSAFVDSSSPVDEAICSAFGLSPDGEEMNKLRWSGLFSNEVIGINKGTSAEVLEHILNKKWKLKKGDKDFIVMWHRFRYELNGKPRQMQAYLTSTGDNEVNTAMAKTVGLPLAITVKLLMQGKVKNRGVLIPIMKEIYDPVLTELGEFGISLKEEEQ